MPTNFASDWRHQQATDRRLRALTLGHALITLCPMHEEDAVALRPLEVVQDVTNAVLEYCAQGFDAMEECAAESLALESTELDSFLKGTAELYTTFHGRLCQHLHTFEEYATETCLHIPVGLMPAQVTLPQTSSSIECNDSSELQLDVELAGLREQIVMTQRTQRQIKQEVAKLEQELASCGGAAQLAAVASASVPEKENLAEGASALVTAALKLQPLLARAQKLRAKDQAITGTSADRTNAASAAGVLAEAQIMKQESLINSLPISRLQMLSQNVQGSSHC